ncbi:hypothetical protein [Staphylococcus aureus]|nr:hypothetical protein [Staphylococcus aureus]MBX7870076.1 hypothetical protein [Staphylococcus aureus]NFW24970.1 hypothetical protein [Staphylococcus aureus]HCU0044059.1 hypothetical protein [Staphylococcus aureus]HEG7245170.1 hypothetical protein [Staphylococcus aureus]
MKFYRQCKLGMGPNTEADEKSAYNNVQVGDGPQHREIGFPISTDNASWRGPNIEKLEFQFLQAMGVGVGRRNKFCENIISVPPHSK